jgi:hypothetical protein
LTVSGASELHKLGLIVDTLRFSGTPAGNLNAAARNAADRGPEPEASTAGVGLLVRGLLSVSVDDAAHALTPEQRARIHDAITELNDAFAAFDAGLILVEGNSSTWADIHVRTDTSSPCGSAADGVLGCETIAGEITIVQGWNWYTGSDPSLVGSNQYDYQTMVMHELGHSIGLGHSTDPKSVMYGTLSTGQARRALSAADVGANDAESEDTLTTIGVSPSPWAPTTQLPRDRAPIDRRHHRGADLGGGTPIRHDLPVLGTSIDRQAYVLDINGRDPFATKSPSYILEFHQVRQGDNILLAGEGDDLLLGCAGQDLLIAGFGMELRHDRLNKTASDPANNNRQTVLRNWLSPQQQVDQQVLQTVDQVIMTDHHDLLGIDS